jgi:hypothetical protein
MTDKTETTGKAIATVTQDYGIDVNRVIAMRSAVEEVIAKVLREGEHYGSLPGDKGKDGKPPKKMLKQPGAEVLCQVFRVRPEYEELALVERDDFISIKIMCRLYNSVTGERVGEAIGSANSREDKYASQVAAKLCPTCGAPTIFKSKDGGLFCWAKKGGCGATFAAEDKKLLDQTGTVSVQRLYGLYHTLESIAQKRGYVKATRTFTATSDIFTDEDAPAEDGDDHGQTTTHAQRTQTKPAVAPKAGVTDVQKLTAALTKAQIGTADTALPPEEQREQAKRAKLGWANGHLADAGQAEVKGFLELTPEQVKMLTEKAERGECPSGW